MPCSVRPPYTGCRRKPWSPCTVSWGNWCGRGLEDWEGWWAALQQEPALGELFAERARRFAWKGSGSPAAIIDLHEAALRDGGFREVGVIWQQMGNRVLMAVR